MTPEQLRRLQNAIALQPEGELFIVVPSSDDSETLLPGAAQLQAARLIAASSVTDALQGMQGTVQIDLRGKDLDARISRMWNQQRQQFRSDGSVLLVITPKQAETLSRHAPDLWKWAAVMDLSDTKPMGNWRPSEARGRIEGDAYAPGLDAGSVHEPTGSFEHGPEED